MSELSNNFYTIVCPKQTVSLRALQIIMRETGGFIIAMGHGRQLVYRKLAPSVYELYLKPERDEVCPYCRRKEPQKSTKLIVAMTQEQVDAFTPKDKARFIKMLAGEGS